MVQAFSEDFHDKFSCSTYTHPVSNLKKASVNHNVSGDRFLLDTNESDDIVPTD